MRKLRWIGCGLSPARVVQERVDAGLSLRGGTGGIDNLAIRVLLVICGCLLMPFNCAAEAPAAQGRQHLQVLIGVNSIESATIQQYYAKSLGDDVSLSAPIPPQLQAVPQKKAEEKSRETDQPRVVGVAKVHWLIPTIFYLLMFVVGFRYSYGYPLRTRADWGELWKDVKWELYRIGLWP